VDKDLISSLMKNSKDLRVLYVEDNKDVRESTKEILERFFQDISLGMNGLDGLEKFEQNEYDVVITDINMPVMNGIEMIKNIRKTDNDIPILIISAHSESGYFMDAIKQNIDGYLLKPLEMKQLINQLLKTVEKIRLIKENSTYKEGLEIQIQERTDAVEFMFYHNNLTGLKNNNALLEDIENEDFTAVLILDLDNLQDFNDFYGLSVGNKIIELFADTLESSLDDSVYSVYHFHNDKFMLRMKNNNYNLNNFEKDIKVLIEKIDDFKFYLDEVNEAISVDVTIGVSFDQDYAIEKAMMALKYAKKGKRSYAVYKKLIDRGEASKESLFWKDEIKKAVKQDKIVPVFQSIVNRDKQIVKYEALMRLVQIEDTKEKMISPFFFLETAIKSKQYSKLTKIMVEKSFKIMKENGKDFSINLSFEDINNSSTIKMLKDQIEKYQVGKQLILEIVESECLADYVVVKNFVKDFRKFDVRIAIDDFGAGFSNYMHILEIEPDYLKLDGSMIKEIDKSKKSYEFVKSIVGLTKALGITTIAEFVHSQEVFETCFELGVDQYQGYYFSPPVKESELEALEVGASISEMV